MTQEDSDSDDDLTLGLEALLTVVQHRTISVRNAMEAESNLDDPVQRQRCRHLRVTKQLEMLEAARRAYLLSAQSSASRPTFLPDDRSDRNR